MTPPLPPHVEAHVQQLASVAATAAANAGADPTVCTEATVDAVLAHLEATGWLRPPEGEGQPQEKPSPELAAQFLAQESHTPLYAAGEGWRQLLVGRVEHAAALAEKHHQGDVPMIRKVRDAAAYLLDYQQQQREGATHS